MLCALIMAGGKGTRFWPLSTEKKPKQFLRLIGEETMIQMTVARINKILSLEKIFICTSKDYVDIVKEQLPGIPKKNIIVEPVGRNTAPSITVSTMIINKYYKDTNIVVLPSDHLINDEDKFVEIIQSANNYLGEKKDAIITLGMKPNRAETGYGYIKTSEEYEKTDKHLIIKAEKFVEKPNKEIAQLYIQEEKYLWNGGIFIWNARSILNKIREYIPKTFEAVRDIENANESEVQNIIDNNYKNTDAISIDYAILEKSNEVYVIPSDIGWDDVGSWEAVNRYIKDDKSGNKILGKCIPNNSNNNILISNNLTIYIDELEDIYVVENDGKVIIGRKQNINKIIEFRS